MRYWTLSLILGLGMILGAAPARAYQLNLIPTTPTGSALIGDIVSYAVFLNTEGASDITLFSVSFSFDPAVMAYREDLSENHSYYPLYAPAAGKTQPATWLQPIPFTDGACGGVAFCGNNAPQQWNGNPAPIGAHVNIDFIEVNLNNTVATATNLLLSRISFEIIGVGVSDGEWGFTNGGNVFSVNGVDVSGDPYVVSANGSARVGPLIPEPTTALLVGLGLAGLGLVRRRRA